MSRPGDAQARVFRTGTRVDTGGWFRQGRVLAMLDGGALTLSADGPRPFVERISLTLLRKSLYNAATGEVDLAPATGARLQRLKLDPARGRDLVCVLKTQEKEKENSHA